MKHVHGETAAQRGCQLRGNYRAVAQLLRRGTHYAPRGTRKHLRCSDNESVMSNAEDLTADENYVNKPFQFNFFRVYPRTSPQNEPLAEFRNEQTTLQNRRTKVAINRFPQHLVLRKYHVCSAQFAAMLASRLWKC